MMDSESVQFMAGMGFVLGILVFVIVGIGWEILTEHVRKRARHRKYGSSNKLPRED